MNEVWKTVVIDGVEHPRYQVSNLGRVKCLDWHKSGNEKLIKPHIANNGYCKVNIDSKPTLLHRIICEAFLPNPEGKRCIDHIDTNKQNNVIEVDKNGIPVENSTITNLRWCTFHENNMNPITNKRQSENARKPALGKFGADHPNSKKIVQLSLDLKLIKIWDGVREASRELNINQRNISSCLTRTHNRITAGGYRWMYLSDWLKVCKRKPEDIKPLF